MLQVLELIKKREGIGNLLAEGTARMAEKLERGSGAFAINVKGLELGLHEPRLKRGLGLGYAVAPVGADHGMGIHDTYYASDNKKFHNVKALGFIEPFPADDMGPGKVSLVADLQRWRNFEDSLVICYFVPFEFEQLIDVVKAVTGWNTSIYEAIKAGERGIHLARLFNIREGIGPDKDWLPQRFMEPVPKGNIKGTCINVEELRQSIAYYYEEMGWTEQGTPKKYVLEKLGIGWAIDYLKDVYNQ